LHGEAYINYDREFFPLLFFPLLFSAQDYIKVFLIRIVLAVKSASTCRPKSLIDLYIQQFNHKSNR